MKTYVSPEVEAMLAKSEELMNDPMESDETPDPGFDLPLDEF